MFRRPFLLAPLIVICLLALVAGGYWLWWAGQLERGIAAWRADKQLRGYEIAYEGPNINGFPFAHVASFLTPAIRLPNGTQWRGPALSARAPLWDPQHVVVDLAGRHVLDNLAAGQLQTAQVDSREAEVLLRLQTSGRLESAHAALRGLEVLAEPLGRFASGALTVLLEPDYGAGGAGGPVFAHGFAVEARNLRVPEALAAPLDEIAESIFVAGRLEGFLPQAEPRLALAAWRDSGGALDLEQIDIDWAPVVFSASGRLSLDDRLRPQGALAARIVGLPALLDRLEAQGLMTQQVAANMKQAVLVFSGERDEEGRPVFAAPIILRDGMLSLGPFPLARISPVL